MGARKKMENFDVEQIMNRVSTGTASTGDQKIILEGLELIRTLGNAGFVKGDNVVVDGDEAHEKAMAKIGKIVGARLADARKAKELSQDALAEKSQVSQSTISKIENGARMITPGEARKLAKVLKVTPQFLIAGEE